MRFHRFHLVTISALAAVVIAAVSAGAQTLLDRYSFNDGTADDSVGGRNGILVGNATVSSGVLNLTGGNHLTSYATLPIGSVITGNSSLSVEAWFTSTANTNYAKVFMFGQDQSNFLCYTPDYDNGPARLEIETAGQYNFIDGVNQPTLNLEHQIVAVYDFVSGTMSYYLDGVLAASGPETVFPSELSSAANNYIGASLFNDLDFQGSVDELRIYSGALSANQVSAEYADGPNALAVPEPGTMALVIGGLTMLIIGIKQNRRLRGWEEKR